MARNEFANIYLKEQTKYIQNQIDKIRNSVENRQSRITWQTVNEVSRRKSTAKAKLKAASQKEQIHLRKHHFENLLGNPPKVTHEPITRIIIIIIIMSCRQHKYTWPSLATSPYYSSPQAGLQGYILCPHIAAVCKFELVVLLLLGQMWGSISKLLDIKLGSFTQELDSVLRKINRKAARLNEIPPEVWKTR